ncbi:AlwI family type II restriction endonuclease [Helicobacter muridarum]|uniref:AlwI family type II restriction endonuclease n=1 Tax=Helicobacter muridarum TaxID=216 RepID=A0A099TZ21_9HELI|nr:AlwI family type II restriction endonuclease [Helicobacter muridarum]TLD99931.1 AlwI family type II restriction endonuclease [Helicobacter muridarum]STQ86851.1 AlwI restriction endonuclease family protein [Helicobacter muridarum]
MRYDYFGNTSLRVKNLLYNFESQLLLFEDLFKNTDETDVWANDSELQLRYLELLEQHNLLESKNKTTHLGTKDARVKSAPLEDYNLIKRKDKQLTKQGYELLNLIKNQSYKINNEFLQIDLISLFFLKATLNFSKSDNLLQKYLEIFKPFNGNLDIEIFTLLPLVNNFKNTQDFIQTLQNKTTIQTLLLQDSAYKQNLQIFLNDLENNALRVDYFKTAKGEKTALSIVKTLQEVFLPFKDSKNTQDLEKLFNPNEYEDFKKLYLPYLTKQNKKADKIKDLTKFCEGSLEEFGKRFFKFIFEARIWANLHDYLDLNRRYLNLTGIFEFDKDKVSVNTIFAIILKHSKHNEILEKIAKNTISEKLLSEYFNNKEFEKYFKELGIANHQDIKNYKYNLDKEKLENLLQTRFQKEYIIEILRLFENRKNDKLIFEKTTTEATIPTIFEYIIAIAWYYIDNNKIECILQAGLSLDSNLLPKSHAVGGNADFVYSYKNHHLMIEATLTEKTNQRRAEMESVSRHLGNLLLSLDSNRRSKSYGIFIAPYLDKNVLNDFRSRLNCYFENENTYISGMKILPLSTQDLIKILESKSSYNDLFPTFQKLLASSETWGSKWYQTQIKTMINNLQS